MRRHVMRGLALASLVGLLVAPSAWATMYKIDADHSTVGFKIRHLFSKVHGSFREFQGAFVYVPGQPEQWSAEATIQTASIDTAVGKRDDHLRSKDFFDVQRYPALTFKSTQVSDATPTGAKLHGMLTMHGVEQPVVLDVTPHGEGKDPWGNVRSGFTAMATINRKDFGLAWNQPLETGQLLVGEEVEIVLEIEGIAQP